MVVSLSERPQIFGSGKRSKTIPAFPYRRCGRRIRYRPGQQDSLRCEPARYQNSGCRRGGFIATTDSGLADRIRACCNFGFRNSRTAVLPAVEWENERIPCCRCAGQPGSLAVDARAARPNFAMLPRGLCVSPGGRASAGLRRWLGLQHDECLAAWRFRGIDFPSPGASRH